MRTNTTKQLLLSGRPAFGTGLGLGSPIAAEVLSHSGVDFVQIDAQHGTFGSDSLIATLTAIATGPATPTVRVARNDYTVIGRLLDDGALGIIVPMVDSAEDAKAVADACRFPPHGRRSWGWGRASHLGADYPDAIDEQVLVLVQIESATAVTNAEAILSTPGIDGCWVGPGDLSLSMGVRPSDPPTDERVLQAIDQVLVACRNTGTIPGYASGTAEEAMALATRGFQYLIIGYDVGYIELGVQESLTRLARSSS